MTKGVGIKRDLTDAHRRAIYQVLLRKLTNGILPHGAIKETAKRFNTSTRTISRVWKRGRESSSKDFLTPGSVESRKKGRSGRKSRREEDIKAAVRNVPMNERSTLRTLSSKSGIPRSSLHRAVKRGTILRHSNPVHPLLTEENKRRRLSHALSHVSLNTRSKKYRIDNMYSYVHLDEKWFNIMKENKVYYLTPEETKPHCRV